ncbi:MAG TPA: hypothetical protein VJY35_03165 [Candidatus Eisenbacteria bacterium]|nr:hypothetical protein [Candidatus Eisenbacteria bacterium]
MNRNMSKSLRKSAVLGALLLLAATASSCGVGMPTAPSIDPSASDPGTSAGVMARYPGTPEELDDPTLGGGSYEKPQDPDLEIFIPSPGGPGNSDWGHSRQRHNK